MISEMIHTASLIHDDVIDQSNFRRGKPSVNVLWNHRKVSEKPFTLNKQNLLSILICIPYWQFNSSQLLQSLFLIDNVDQFKKKIRLVFFYSVMSQKLPSPICMIIN